MSWCAGAEGAERERDLSLTREVLLVEVRCVSRDGDDFSRRVARQLRRERSLALLSRRHSARDVALRLDGRVAARVARSRDELKPRFASTRCDAALPRGALVYFEVELIALPEDARGRGDDSDSDGPDRRGINALAELAIGVGTCDAPRDAQCGAVATSAAVLSLGGARVCDARRRAIGALLPTDLLPASLGSRPHLPQAVSRFYHAAPIDDDVTDDPELRRGLFGLGSIVGVLAYQHGTTCRLSFAVDGDLVFTAQLALPSTGTRLYPTITFRSRDVAARVMFTADEIKSTALCRSALCVPEDAPVYAIDGTRVL